MRGLLNNFRPFNLAEQGQAGASVILAHPLCSFLGLVGFVIVAVVAISAGIALMDRHGIPVTSRLAVSGADEAPAMAEYGARMFAAG